MPRAHFLSDNGIFDPTGQTKGFCTIMLRKAVKPKLLGLFIAICTVGIIIVGYQF